MSLKFAIVPLIVLAASLGAGHPEAAPPEVFLTIGKRSPAMATLLVPPVVRAGEWRPVGVAPELTEILRADLDASGYFTIPGDTGAFEPQMAREGGGPIDVPRWREMGGTILVKTSFSGESDLSLDVRIHDLTTGLSIHHRTFTGPHAARRRLVHEAADEIVYRLTGNRGVARTKIAYISDLAGEKEVMVMDYDGAGATRVTSMKSITLFPAWSPDGAFLAYTSYRDNNPDLYLIRADGRELRRLVDFGGLNAHASWSPDGRTIALTLSRDGNAEIYLYDIRRKEVRRLTTNAANDTSPDWSPDGNRIVFTSDRTGSPQLYLMDTDGGNVTRLTFAGEFNDTAAWSPSGDAIAYASMRGGIFRIHAIAPDGSGDRPLITGTRNCEDPAWSPDGRHLAFTVNTGERQQIHRLDIDAGSEVTLTKLGRRNASPDWSPFSGGW